MCLAEYLLKLSDDFYSGFTPLEKKRNQGLNLLYRKLKENISHGLEGFSDDQNEMLLGETIGDLTDLMDQVTSEEKERNPEQRKKYAQLRRTLRRMKSEMALGCWDENSIPEPEDPAEIDEEEWASFVEEHSCPCYQDHFCDEPPGDLEECDAEGWNEDEYEDNDDENEDEDDEGEEEQSCD